MKKYTFLVVLFVASFGTLSAASPADLNQPIMFEYGSDEGVYNSGCIHDPESQE